jgi:SpoVK/Ycf46/Vps4 family AAA+-type ATPase
VARVWELPLLKLDAGRLYDKYIGESEKNFRRAIALAESMAPAVLWIDEIEKGLAPTGGDSDAGLSRRIFGSFLTWLQEKRKDVFVIATANDLSILPPELLRKGRFDEIFFVDLPVAEEREEIFRIHLELRNQDPARFDLARLAAASDGFSGAEIEQAVIASLYGSLQRKAPLDSEQLLAEIAGTKPLSVTRREDVERLRATAEGRFVPVR